MKILQVHNKYRPGWGGEDTVADLEADLLRRNGHEVERLSAWTKDLDGASALRLLVAGFETIWSFSAYSRMKVAISRFSPDIVHIHNTFPLLSPSVFWAAESAGVPVVWTLHNYRVACANGLLLRKGVACEDCVGQFPLPALRNRCLGDSLPRTAAVTSMNLVHKTLGTFKTKVHACIALTEFSRNLLTRAGLPRDRVHVKPNFTIAPANLTAPRRPQFVFAGQIARFKGIHLLLEAWRNVAQQEYRLVLIGDGEDRAELQERYRNIETIIWCGSQPRDTVVNLIAESRWVVLPSLVYENFPMSVLEAFSVGTPVIVSNHGSLASIVSHELEGLLFRPGDVASLMSTLRFALESENRWPSWSVAARNKYLQHYTDRTNYEQLLAIYRKAADVSRGRHVVPEQQEAGQFVYAKPCTPTASSIGSENRSS